MIAAARRATKRVAAPIPGSQPTLRTSRPCAVTTSGARPASAPISPVGTRKCAYTTSGLNRREAARVARVSLRYLTLPPPASIENRALDLVAAHDELFLEAAHEDSEVGVGRSGVHLGDEQDPHRPLYSLAV